MHWQLKNAATMTRHTLHLRNWPWKNAATLCIYCTPSVISLSSLEVDLAFWGFIIYGENYARPTKKICSSSSSHTAHTRTGEWGPKNIGQRSSPSLSPSQPFLALEVNPWLSCVIELEWDIGNLPHADAHWPNSLLAKSIISEVLNWTLLSLSERNYPSSIWVIDIFSKPSCNNYKKKHHSTGHLTF